MTKRAFLTSVSAPLAAIAALSPIHLAAKETVRISPYGPWQVNYADDSCRLARIFGTKESRSVFYIERYAPTDGFFMVVAGPPFSGGKRTEVEIQFGPNEEVQDTEVFLGRFGDFEPSLIFSGVNFAGEEAGEEVSSRELLSYDFAPEREAAIEWLAVQRRGRDRILLELGPMGEPMEALRACTDELLTHWGIDIEKHRKLTRAVEPKGDPGRWMGPRDYPTDLLREGAQGLVRFRLTVDAEGEATDCHIQKSTRPEGFDKAVCEALMRKAKFEPALGEDGEPIVSFWRNTVRFEIPR